MHNLRHILRLDFKRTRICILIKILNTIFVSGLSATNSQSTTCNSTDGPVSISRLFIPCNNRAIKSNRRIRKSNRATCSNGFASGSRLIKSNAALVDINTEVKRHVFKREHSVSNRQIQSTVVEVFAPKPIGSSCSDLLILNGEVKCAFSKRLAYCNQLIVCKQQCSCNPSKKFLSHYVPPILFLFRKLSNLLCISFP